MGINQIKFCTYLKDSDPIKDNSRLDLILNSCFPDISRSQILKYIKSGLVKVDGEIAKKQGSIVSHGQTIEIDIAQIKKSTITPKKIDLEILYEDQYIIVVNKPAGLVVHPGAGFHDVTLVAGLLEHCDGQLSYSQENNDRPGILHRLDKDTSGILIVTKTDLAHQYLSNQLSKRKIKRLYWAWIWGELKQNESKVDLPIGRHKKDRKKMAVSKSGKEAVTNFKVISSVGGASLVECSLETGRTHQIRVHMHHIGHPIMGDQTYKGKPPTVATQHLRDCESDLKRQALHAHTITFKHPKTRNIITLHAPIPEELENFSNSIGLPICDR